MTAREATRSIALRRIAVRETGGHYLIKMIKRVLNLSPIMPKDASLPDVEIFLASLDNDGTRATPGKY